MKTTRKLLPLAILAALGLSAGCSVTEQDGGIGGEATVDGLAVDGYLAGAVVYVDTNDNNALDPWEPSAITDGDGYYSFNPNTNTDYCALPKGETRRVHCLSVTAALGEVTLRVSGGYDLITKEPFEGTMAVKVDLQQAAAGNPATVNPLTSLLDLMDPSARAQWLDTEGLDEAAVRGDLLEGLAVAADRSDENDPVTATDLDPVRLAWMLHKLVDVFAARLEAAYDADQFGTSGQPDDATHFVYQALAEVIAQAQQADTSLTTAAILADNAKLAEVLDAAAALITAAGITGTGLTATPAQDLAAWGSKLATAVTNMFTGVSTKGDLEARARAIEVIAALMRDSTNITLQDPPPAALQNALTLAGDSTYLANLRSNKVDVNHLVGRFRDGNGSLTAADADYSARQSLTAQMGVNGELAGETLSMGNNGDNAVFTFNPDGTLDAQIAFDDPDLQIANDQPLAGTWEQVDDYTLVLNLEVAEGVTMPVIVKTTVDGNYSFDLGGEQATWVQQQTTP